MMAFQYRAGAQPLSDAREKLDDLRDRMAGESGDEAFIQKLRGLDTIYRQAYFVSLEQERRGLRLLALALTAMFASAAAYALFDAPIPVRPDPRIEGKKTLRDNRWFFLGVAVVLAAPLSVSAFLFSRVEENARDPIEVVNTTPTGYAAPPEYVSLYASLEEMRRNWTQFRGDSRGAPDGGQSFRFIENAEWEIAWRIDNPLPGFGSPIVWDDRVFISGGDERSRAVFAFSAADGSLLWRHDVGAGARLPKVTDDTGYAAPTPATDGRRVYAAFATGQIVACDFTTGARVWSHTLPPPEILYGYASSLLLHEDRLVVQFFTDDHHSVYALDAATGEIAWENSDGEPDGKAMHASWSSPTIAFDREGRPVIVVTGGNAVEAYDFRTGRRLWTNSCLYGEVATSPAAMDGRGGFVLFAHVGVGAGALDIATGETVWLNEDILLPDVASPLAADDFLYVATSSGFVSCLSLGDGKLVWEHETRGG